MLQDQKSQKSVLNLVERLWKKMPHLRFMQLLGNCFEDDPYYVTDEKLTEKLKIVYKEYL